MKGMSWMSPRGPVSIDPDTRDMVQNIYVRKVEKVDGALFNVEFDTSPTSRTLQSVEELISIALGSRDSSGPSVAAALVRAMPALVLTILFDGVAYGMLLFVLACGLAVTLGLMNFVNLAHGVFAMAGGYRHGAADEPRRRSLSRHACPSPS